MDATIFATKPTLAGERTVLRPFTPADIEAMAGVLADPEVLRLTGSVHTTKESMSARPVHDSATRRWYESRHEQPDRLDLAVVDRATDECVGEVVLNEYDPANRSCGFRILIGPNGRGRGLGSEATRNVLDYAFGNTDLHRISLEVYAFNPRAQHVYRTAGFVLEGRLRGALLFDGRFIDAFVMSVLRTDREATTTGVDQM